jgi:hypothetical protein
MLPRLWKMWHLPWHAWYRLTNRWKLLPCWLNELRLLWRSQWPKLKFKHERAMLKT